MATNGTTEEELWTALAGLDDDLLDPDMPHAIIEGELTAIGLDPAGIAKRGIDFVTKVKEEERLAWQTRARERRAKLEARASTAVVATGMDRAALLARMEQLRGADSKIGSAIQMAARKRRPEESTDEELRTLLEQMEALRAIEDSNEE